METGKRKDDFSFLVGLFQISNSESGVPAMYKDHQTANRRMASDKPLYERPIDENRRMTLICIGAGYSGTLTAIRFPQKIPNIDLVIYEKNEDIGET